MRDRPSFAKALKPFSVAKLVGVAPLITPKRDAVAFSIVVYPYVCWEMTSLLLARVVIRMWPMVSSCIIGLSKEA